MNKLRITLPHRNTQYIQMVLMIIQLVMEVTSEKDDENGNTNCPDAECNYPSEIRTDYSLDSLANIVAFRPTFPPRRPLHTRFFPTATNVTYERGGLAVLYCSVEDLGTKTIIWRKQPYNVPITIGTEQFVELDRFHLNHIPHKDEWNLLIKNVQPFDAGVYECQISSKKKTMRRNITLNVIEKGHHGWPSIHISGTRFVEKGASIFLLCNASNTDSPPEGLDWFKDGNLLTKRKTHTIHIQEQLSVSTNTIVSALRIDNVEMSDTGTYVCRTSGLLTTRFKVDVLNAETYNVKREFEKQSERIRDQRPSGNSGNNGHEIKNRLTVNVISVIVTLSILKMFR